MIGNVGKNFLTMSDEDLVAAACEGTDAASVVLVARYKDAVMNCATRMTGSEELGLEITLRMMELVRRRPERLSGKVKCLVQIYRLTLEMTRKMMRDAERITASREAEPVPDFDLEGGPPPEYVESGHEKLQRCLVGLPVKYRSYLVLRDVIGISYEDIAAIFNEHIDKAREISDRARDQLQDALERGA